MSVPLTARLLNQV